MALRIAINGMGVIGREMLKTLFYQEGIEVILLNDIVSPKNLEYLLKYDSLYHDKKLVTVTSTEDSIVIEGKEIKLCNCNNLNDLPLGNYGVDIVLECTGSFKNKAACQAFLSGGAKKVVACYGLGNDLPNIVPNVNMDNLTPDQHILCIPQMETQVMAAVLKLLNDELVIQGGLIKAFRSFTNAQPTMDSYVSGDCVRGRAAPVNITPVSDGFAKNIGLVIPELNGKINGLAYRSPVINGSIMDFTIKTKTTIDSDNLRKILKAGQNESLGYNEDALCSSDALAFDAPQIIVQKNIIMPLEDGSSLINLSVAYDNVRGYCNQVARFLDWAKSNWS